MKNLLILLFMLLAHSASAGELFGTVDALAGEASLSDPDGQPGGLTVGQNIYSGQTITTSASGEVHLVTEDGGMIALRPDTVFRVDDYQAEGDSTDKIFMSLFKGAMRSITGWIGKHNPSGYLITTPSATIGVRGTDHETTVIEHADGDEAGTYDTVNEGATLLKTQHGEIEVAPGKYAFASKHGVAAPVMLARRPNFLATRRLRIEERIEQRKAFLREHMERMREQRIERLRSVRGQRVAGAQRASEIRGREAEQRAAQRDSRREQMKQRRAAQRQEQARKRERAKRNKQER